MNIAVQPLSGSRLVEDYLAGSRDLAPFFAGWPFDPDAFRQKADEVDARFPGDSRRAALEAIRPASPAAADRLARMADDGGFFITTGQQPGFLGGPLFTAYKIFSAVNLARALEPVLQRPVAPLFWVAADDHDWDEVRAAYLLDLQNQVSRFELPGPADPPYSMGRRTVNTAIASTFDELAQILPESEFAPSLLSQIRDAYRPGRTVAAAYGELLVQLFARVDLSIIDASHSWVRRNAADIHRRAILEWREQEALVAEQTIRLRAAGYHEQVTAQPGASHVFYEDDHGRERLVHEDGGWTLRRTNRRFREAKLLSLLETAPDRFSPNVLLRPVVESALLPTLAYVAGPSEIGYLAQTGCLFRGYGVGMPLVSPRGSAALIEDKVGKVLDTYGLDVTAFSRPDDAVANELARDELPEDVVAGLRMVRQGLAAGYARVKAAAEAVDSTLAAPLEKALRESESVADGVERRIVRHIKRRNEVVLAQLGKARNNLYPTGRPQERVLSMVHYLARYGPELLDRLADSLPVAIDDGQPGWAGVECVSAGALPSEARGA